MNSSTFSIQEFLPWIPSDTCIFPVKLSLGWSQPESLFLLPQPQTPEPVDALSENCPQEKQLSRNICEDTSFSTRRARASAPFPH